MVDQIGEGVTARAFTHHYTSCQGRPRKVAGADKYTRGGVYRPRVCKKRHIPILNHDVVYDIVWSCLSYAGESFYGSPPKFSLTKSPVFKPAPCCTSRNMASLATSTSLFDNAFENKKIYGRRFLNRTLLCVKLLFSGGGYRRICPVLVR